MATRYSKMIFCSETESLDLENYFSRYSVKVDVQHGLCGVDAEERC